MKARIKKTKEIVEVFQIKPGVYIDEEHRSFYVESLDFILDEEKHWQDVREHAAIAAMQGIMNFFGSIDYNDTSDKVIVEHADALIIAKLAVEQADALIKELKRNSL